jgi:hypothetical protein
MNGFVRRILPQDGYVLVGPHGLLVDGYQYNIVRGAQVLVFAEAFAIDGHPVHIALRSIDPVQFPMSVVQRGDIVKRSS